MKKKAIEAKRYPGSRETHHLGSILEEKIISHGLTTLEEEALQTLSQKECLCEDFKLEGMQRVFMYSKTLCKHTKIEKETWTYGSILEFLHQ